MAFRELHEESKQGSVETSAAKQSVITEAARDPIVILDGVGVNVNLGHSKRFKSDFLVVNQES